MREFKDKDSGSWRIDLTVGTVTRVKNVSGGRFNLFDPGGRLGDDLVMDEGTFWELLWFIVEPQARERSITAEIFGEKLAADCLHNARQMFFEEWRDFFRLLHRPERAAVVEKAQQYLAKGIELAMEKLKDRQLDDLVERRMRSNLNDSFGSLLASLESTPKASPGDSSTN